MNQSPSLSESGVFSRELLMAKAEGYEIVEASFPSRWKKIIEQKLISSSIQQGSWKIVDTGSEIKIGFKDPVSKVMRSLILARLQTDLAEEMSRAIDGTPNPLKKENAQDMPSSISDGVAKIRALTRRISRTPNSD